MYRRGPRSGCRWGKSPMCHAPQPAYCGSEDSRRGWSIEVRTATAVRASRILYLLALTGTALVLGLTLAHVLQSPGTRSLSGAERSEEHTSELQSRGHLV